MDPGGGSAAAINDFYSITLPASYVQTAPIPRDWLDGVTLPSTAIDAEPSWQEAEIIGWFDERGVEFFEPLEIWHVPALRAEFRRRPGRNPKPDRSYMPPWPVRARRFGKRVFHAVKRRISVTADVTTMPRPYLTVLTLPILPAPRRFYQALRRTVRTVVKPGVPVPGPSPFPGHFALVRSVVEGLQAIRADFNFNPRSFGELARVVYAPANEALRQAIELKRRGAVDYVVAGPVNALFADESDGILQAPEIDLVIVPSDWTIDLYRGFPALVGKSRVCPCGVDAEVWKPAAA